MTTSRQAELKRLRNLAYLLDNSFRIPVIGYRFGLEPLLGLIPVVGDAAGYLFSGYLIWQARRFNAPRSLITKMFVYATLDFAVGSIPVVGDIFDFFFKANARNYRLLERYLSSEGQPAAS